MRIAYLCSDLGVPLSGHKGASAHVRALIQAWASEGHDVVVFASDVGSGETKNARVIPIPLPAVAAGTGFQKKDRVFRALRHLWNNVAVEETLLKFLPTLRPDLLYERYSPFGVAGAHIAKRLGIPHLLEVNAPLAWEGKEYRRQALQEAADFLEAEAFASCSRIVAVSHELKEMLAGSGVPASKVVVVPNGVDVDLFRPEGQVIPARSAGDETIVIGFVGSLKPWHGIDLLAEAFEKLGANERLELLVVGEGPSAKIVDGLKRQFPTRVRQVGAVAHHDVPKYVRAMDIAVAPYPDLERFYFSPLKVLEYMATGRAIVASSLGQIRELIRNGHNGVLARPGSAESLASSIELLASDRKLRRELGKAAMTTARRRHQWSHRAAEILDLVAVAAG